MVRKRVSLTVAFLVLGAAACYPMATPSAPPTLTSYYTQWVSGPDPAGDPGYFPIGVWEQGADRSENGVPNPVAYKGLGINVDVGGYDGVNGLTDASAFVTYTWNLWAQPDTPTDPLGEVKAIQSQPAMARQVTGWENGDEHDMNRVNCSPPCADDQPLGVLASGNAIRQADPTRPVYVNFGKPASLQSWQGYYPTPQTGSWLSDFQTYCSAVDLLSSDIYAYTTTDSLITHGAWEYGRVVDYVQTWCPGKPYYAFIETGHPFPDGGTITAPQIQAAVWDSILHGASGILYFVHDFYTGGFREDGLLTDNKGNAPTVQAVDSELAALAPWLNQGPAGAIEVTSTGGVPITTMLKTYNGVTYLFAMADGNAQMVASGSTTATFTVGANHDLVPVYNESRSVPVVNNQITDSFAPYQVHVYQLDY